MDDMEEIYTQFKLTINVKPGFELKKMMQLIEMKLINKIVEKSPNKSMAARVLGLNRTTMLEKIRRHQKNTVFNTQIN